MNPGDLISFMSPVRAFDDENTTYWVTDPALVLEQDDYDVTLLSFGKVLYTSTATCILECVKSREEREANEEKNSYTDL